MRRWNRLPFAVLAFACLVAAYEVTSTPGTMTNAAKGYLN